MLPLSQRTSTSSCSSGENSPQEEISHFSAVSPRSSSRAPQRPRPHVYLNARHREAAAPEKPPLNLDFVTEKNPEDDSPSSSPKTARKTATSVVKTLKHTGTDIKHAFTSLSEKVPSVPSVSSISIQSPRGYFETKALKKAAKKEAQELEESITYAKGLVATAGKSVSFNKVDFDDFFNKHLPHPSEGSTHNLSYTQAKFLYDLINKRGEISKEEEPFMEGMEKYLAEIKTHEDVTHLHIQKQQDKMSGRSAFGHTFLSEKKTPKN